MISRSRSSQSNSQTSSTNVQNLNLQDVEGITLADATGNTINVLDGGAIGGALDFAGAALSRSADVLDADRGFLRDVFEGSGTFARDVFGDALETVEGVLRDGQAQLGNTVSALNSIAKEQNTSADQRVQELAGQALKVGALMVGLIVAAIIFTRARA